VIVFFTSNNAQFVHGFMDDVRLMAFTDSVEPPIDPTEPPANPTDLRDLYLAKAAEQANLSTAALNLSEVHAENAQMWSDLATESIEP